MPRSHSAHASSDPEFWRQLLRDQNWMRRMLDTGVDGGASKPEPKPEPEPEPYAPEAAVAVKPTAAGDAVVPPSAARDANLQVRRDADASVDDTSKHDEIQAVTKIAARLRGKAARARVKAIKAKLSALDAFMDALVDGSEQGEADQSPSGVGRTYGGFGTTMGVEGSTPLPSVPTDWASQVVETIGQEEAWMQ